MKQVFLFLLSIVAVQKLQTWRLCINADKKGRSVESPVKKMENSKLMFLFLHSFQITMPPFSHHKIHLHERN